MDRCQNREKNDRYPGAVWSSGYRFLYQSESRDGGAADGPRRKIPGQRADIRLESCGFYWKCYFKRLRFPALFKFTGCLVPEHLNSSHLPGQTVNIAERSNIFRAVILRVYGNDIRSWKLPETGCRRKCQFFIFIYLHSCYVEQAAPTPLSDSTGTASE